MGQPDAAQSAFDVWTTVPSLLAFLQHNNLAARTTVRGRTTVIDNGWCRAGYEEVHCAVRTARLPNEEIIHDARPASRG